VLVRRVAFFSSTAVLLSAGLMIALGAGAACTHEREPDAVVIDAPKPDAPPVPDAQQQLVTVLVNGEDIPADLDCLEKPRPDAGPIFPAEAGTDAGSETGDDADTSIEIMDTASDGATAKGTLVEKQIEVIGFGTGGADKLANQTIDVYYDNTFKSAPNLTVTSNDKGLINVALPQGLRVGYHVKKSALLGDYFALDDLHEPLPGAKKIIWQGVTLERQEVLALAITGQKGYTIKPGTGIIAGRVMDCKRRYMQHARVVLKDFTTNPAGDEMTYTKCGQGLCLVYLSDAELPDVGRTATSRAALFSLIDVPAGRKLRLVAEGLTPTGLKAVAWRNLEVKDGAIATHLLEPDASLDPPTP
jgi:hypothetical protein